MQRPVRITAPAETPVSLAEIKEHLRVSHADEDSGLTGMIAAATAYLDGYAGILGRCMVSQVWSQSFDEFPSGFELGLPFPDVSSVTVTYRDTDGAAQTLASSVYALVADDGGALLMLQDGQVWPVTAARPDAVTVQMTVGYGAASAVPAALRHAVKVLAGAMYEGREGQMDGAPMFDALIAPYRHQSL
jgi:uncharacterized phiE125 gp8 family phage protein